VPVQRALLIGAVEYGAGFDQLPAVRHDVQLMGEVLAERGFNVEVADSATVENGALLAARIARFCREGAVDNFSIVYFSGHGLSLEGRDWVIPAKTRHEDAVMLSTHRVSTDLSEIAAASRAELVLFIVDACRNESDQSLSKGANSWSKGARSVEPRFVRFFGCGAGQLGHVLRGAHDGKDISVFTKAFADALRAATKDENLVDLVDEVAERCRVLAKSPRRTLSVQKPALDATELNAEMLVALKLPRFRVPNGSSLAAQFRYAPFEPGHLNIVVIASERASLDTGAQSLSDRVNEAITRSGEKLWAVFQRYAHAQELVTGVTRAIPEHFDRSGVLVSEFGILRAFESDAALDTVISTLVKADLVFFDVSGFEPGVLFLVGVRAATRRGVSVCSHGMEWREGEPLAVPYNLMDLQVCSHSTREQETGDDYVVTRLAERVEQGFLQIAQQPRYLDLPAYDALRELGPGLEASGTVTWSALVLLLCPYEAEYARNRRFIQREMEQALQHEGAPTPHVRRLIDMTSPQLASQLLYQYVRRVSVCVMDWTGLNASAFLELGVRLAVSPWGAGQLIEASALPVKPTRSGATSRKKTKSSKARGPITNAELEQINSMRSRLEPTVYAVGDDGRSLATLIETLVKRRPFEDAEPRYNRINRLVRDAIETVTVRYVATHVELQRTADSLNDANQGRTGSPQLLFLGNQIKIDRERAALERRLAAWLYLEHRLNVRADAQNSELVEQYRALGEDVAARLYDSDKPEDQRLGQQIEDALGKLSESENAPTSQRLPAVVVARRKQRLAALKRKRGEALQRLGSDSSRDVFRQGIELLDEAISLLQDPGVNQLARLSLQQPIPAEQFEIASELVETFGARAGLARRIPDDQLTFESYSNGAKLEEQFVHQSTYNRTNAVKCALLTGQRSLAMLTNEIRGLEQHLAQQLATHHELADRGWAWADLADCRALLGEVDGAAKAYDTFIQKAETRAPLSTLDVLRKISAKLESSGDAMAANLKATLVALERHFHQSV
jgi:Caspase domain